ncbi:GNAT family N-acetyltransferase [Caldimonas brevitalea]|uniref:Acetyltransferase n=1 Tax=Caldimonas brevitalea TaxID=413882 RepID=A0A0G3C0A9_9BURK|nr:GNAT family N-acetyltransferase [Caldimonas brevitalea]AKJ32215.1 acetyltransferase [Caldimonas brevitalea]
MLTRDFPLTLLSRTEDAGLNAAAPPEQRWVDGWLVRYNAGKAKRGRCINALAAGQLPLAQRLSLCAEIYRAAQLPLIVRVTPFSAPADLDTQLAHLGLPRFEDTRVMVLARGMRSGADEPPRVEAVDCQTFAEVVGELRGSPVAQRRAHAERLRHAPVPLRGFVLRDADHQVVACGQYTLESTMAGLYDIVTAERARNQGWATRLCTQLLQQASADGARSAYLQVDADNHAARALYHRIGFRDAYAYHYRGENRLPPSGAAALSPPAHTTA